MEVTPWRCCGWWQGHGGVLGDTTLQRLGEELDPTCRSAIIVLCSGYTMGVIPWESGQPVQSIFFLSCSREVPMGVRPW